MQMQAKTREMPLQVWAESRFGEHAPTIGTLRRWARDGKIFPAPRKVGREYMVKQHADYVSSYAEIARLQRESATAQ